MTANLGNTIDTISLDTKDGPARFSIESKLSAGYLKDSTNYYWQHAIGISSSRGYVVKETVVTV